MSSGFRPKQIACRHFPLATLRLAGFGEGLLEFRIGLDEFDACHVGPRRRRNVLVLRFAPVDLAQQGFQSAVVTGPKGPLLLRVFGYFELGTTAAATHGVRRPFCSNTGVGAPLGPSRSHCFRTGGGWTFFGDFRLFDIHILLKTMDIPGHKILYVLESGRRLPAPFPPYTSRIRAPYSRSRQTVIVAAMSSLVSPARALLPSVEGRSVFGARASLSLRAGCPGGGRSRRSPSRLQSAPPVELGPALSSLESGRHVGGAPNTQNPAPCYRHVPD